MQSQDTYHAKVKALRYFEFTQDTSGYQKVKFFFMDIFIDFH